MDDAVEMARFLGMYVLDADDRPVPADDYPAWATWRAEQGHRCRIDTTRLGDITISTVFLAQDHRIGRDSLPILYETAVFKRGECVGVPGRYATREEAQAGHDRVVAEILAPDDGSPEEA
jgi:hypothetical protein